MRVYAVSYELLKKGKDYIGLFEQLKASPTWWHYLDSTWLIATELSASELYKRLAPHLDPNDSILIIQAGTEFYGFLPKDAWNWIQQYIARPA